MDATPVERPYRTSRPHNCSTPNLVRNCCGASKGKRVMQQQIGFCTTVDGARIAYATVGTGPALVVAPFAPSHLGLEWEEPRVRDFWETIGRHHLVVRYDKHGCGLSDRNRTDFSLDSEVRTI